MSCMYTMCQENNPAEKLPHFRKCWKIILATFSEYVEDSFSHISGEFQHDN